MTSIDEQIEKMPELERKGFDKVLQNVLYDRYWCKNHKIDYANPDVQKAKELLYQEMFNPHRN